MRYQKPKIALDFDDTLVQSDEEIIRQLNKKYGLNKTIDDLKCYGYKSIYPTTPEEIFNMYEGQEFFDNVQFYDKAIDFINQFKEYYDISICSKGTKKNIELKREFIQEKINKQINSNINLIGIDFSNIYDRQNNYDKSTVDLSDYVFCLDNNTFVLQTMNCKNKILITHHRNYPWNKPPTYEQNFYVIGNFKDLIQICDFDIKLKEKGHNLW